jgi:hypothetical protein
MKYFSALIAKGLPFAWAMTFHRKAGGFPFASLVQLHFIERLENSPSLRLGSDVHRKTSLIQWQHFPMDATRLNQYL